MLHALGFRCWSSQGSGFKVSLGRLTIQKQRYSASLTPVITHMPKMIPAFWVARISVRRRVGLGFRV